METDEPLYQREMVHRLMIPKEEKRRAGRNELVQINTHTHYSS